MTICDQSEEQARLRSGHRLKAEFINQQQRRRHILAPLQPGRRQTSVDLQRRHQLVEAEVLHREALLDRSDAQTHAQMRLAHPWGTSVILPGVRRLRFGSRIRSILAAARWSPSLVPSVTPVPITS
jgi:hypothetical protein